MAGQDNGGDILSLAASTMRNYKTELVDNIIADSILLAMLGHKDLAPKLVKSRKPEAGYFPEGISLEKDPGREIQFPLQYRKNNTSQSYDGYDELDITPQDPFTAAIYPWRSYAGSINLANSDLDKNSGSKWKIFDFLKGHIMNLETSLSDDITAMLLGTRAAGSKATFGLQDIIQDVPTANPLGGNLGGIDATANAWWQNYSANFGGGAFGTDQTMSGMQAVRKLIRKTTFGTKKATVLLAGESAFESIENTMINQVRYQGPAAQALGEAGFEAFTVKGIPVAMEKQISTSRAAAAASGDAVYALNLNYLKIFGMEKRWFEPSKMKEPVNQDSMVMHIITRLQFATNARRQQGVLYNIAAV